jgi:Ca-activated chloride channel family protein
MLSTWFATPALLWTLLALPICSAAILYAHYRRMQMVARLGNSRLLHKSLAVRIGVRHLKSVCVLTGLALIAIAAAGPQWGLDPEAQHRKGRDVILVLDLSRSMEAEQPSRRELALRALKRLARDFEEHGGNRVALIAFASKAELLFPLTHDYDHLRHVVEQIAANDIADLWVEDAVSGTRIGAALQLAVASHDPTRANRPIVVLLSDGDDPGGDNEWQHGISAAKAKGIRIHTVGFGSPNEADYLYHDGERLSYDGKLVTTKLNEDCLREIASRTGGSYLPAQTAVPPLGVFVQHILDADELREEVPSDGLLPVYQLRYAWFLLPAVVLFALAMMLTDGPPWSNVVTTTVRPVQTASLPAKSISIALALIAMVFVSAAEPATADSYLRKGNEAFATGDYQAALDWYEKVEPLTLDPGLVAFNKAAAYAKLNRHREAIECYRRCLQDDPNQTPAERRARAHFGLGNALVQYAGDNAVSLKEAVAAYRASMHHADLRADARHNLEIAQMLWLKAWEKLSPEKKKDLGPPDDPEYPNDKDGEKRYAPAKPKNGDEMREDSSLPKGQKGDRLHAERLKVIPDEDKVMPMAPETALATLQAEAARIAAARRLQRHRPGSAQLLSKDW